MFIALDSCALIILAKSNLLVDLAKLGVVFTIDTAVFGEVVTRGIAEKHPDASHIEFLLQTLKMQIIPADITKEISYFRDPGEASSFIISEGNICLTSDIRACRKLKARLRDTIMLDSLIVYLVEQAVVDKLTATKWLELLFSQNAFSPLRLFDAKGKLEEL